MRKMRDLILVAAIAFLLMNPAGAKDDYTPGQNEGFVGLYFKVPLGTNFRARKNEKPFEYGLKMQFSNNAGSPHRAEAWAAGYRVDLMAVRFGPSGLDNLTISGIDVFEPHRVWVDEGQEETENGSRGKWILIGLGAAAAVFTVSAIALEDKLDGLVEPNS